MWDMMLKKIDHELLPQLAGSLWDADLQSIKLINSDMSLVYKFKSHSKCYYLRVTHPVIRSQSELNAAIAYQRHLFDYGAPICEPVKSCNGNYIEEVIHHDDTYLVHVNEEIGGEFIHLNHKDKNPYIAWGKSLAHLHRAAKSYHPDHNHRFLDWRDLWEEVGRNIHNEDDVIKAEYEEIDDWFSVLNKTQYDFGITHGDHRLESVLYDGQQVHIIDFDEPVYHWYWADLARPFLEQNPKKIAKWRKKAAWFLEGYSTILPFEDEKINYLPWFIRMKNMDIYLEMKHNPGVHGGGFGYDRLAELCENISNPLMTWNL